MSRDATLPTGAATAAVAPSYVARHAVRIATPTPLLLCEGPGSLVIGGETYLESALVIGDVSIMQWPAISIRVPNDTNQLSEPDANGDHVRRAAVLVYEVMWDPSTGVQLDPVKVFAGKVESVRCNVTTAEVTCKAATAGSALMVGRLISRLCHYVFGGARCGLPPDAVRPGANVVADPTFARISTAYLDNGNSVASGVPRYGPAKFGNGIIVEPGVTNLMSADMSSVEATSTGLTSWTDGTGSYGRVTTDYWSGSACFKATAAGGTQLQVMTFPHSLLAVTGGALYTFSVWVKASSSISLKPSIYWFNASDVNVGYSDGVTVIVGTAWQRLTVTAIAPATATMVSAYVFGPGNCSIYWDGAQFESGPLTSWQLGGTPRVAETLTIPQAAVSNVAGTIEAWVKLLRAPGTINQYIIDLNGGANSSLRLYTRADGKLEVVYGTGSTTVTITGATALAIATLYHVAVTWGSGGVAIYLAGASEGSNATAPALTAGASVYLGSDASGALQLDGILDDLRIENNARTAAQITTDAAATTAAPPTIHTLYKAAFDSSLVHTEGINGVSGCDHRLDCCQAFGNSVRFGGWPSLPRIGTKVSYTLTTAQPIAQRVGTVAPPAPPPVVPTPTRTIPRPVPTSPGAPRVRPRIGR